MRLLNSGTVAMDVSLEKTGFFQGESLTFCSYASQFSEESFNHGWPLFYRRRIKSSGSHCQQLIS